MIPSKPFDTRLVAARPLTSFVRELVFERVDGEAMRFDPGQWVNLVLPLAGGEIKRAYSIASEPTGSARFELAITRVAGGPGSEYLHEIPVGTTLRAIGPQGFFTRDAADASPALFVGTGTGVTPLRSMMRAALLSGSGAPLWLLFGARVEEDALYREELEAFARSRPNVRYAITLSRPGPGWSGRKGYVQAHLPEILADLRAQGGSAEPHAFICGLDRMVSTVKDDLRNALGLNRKHVHTERYD